MVRRFSRNTLPSWWEGGGDNRTHCITRIACRQVLRHGVQAFRRGGLQTQMCKSPLSLNCEVRAGHCSDCGRRAQTEMGSFLTTRLSSAAAPAAEVPAPSVAPLRRWERRNGVGEGSRGGVRAFALPLAWPRGTLLVPLDLAFLGTGTRCCSIAACLLPSVILFVIAGLAKNAWAVNCPCVHAVCPDHKRRCEPKGSSASRATPRNL